MSPPAIVGPVVATVGAKVFGYKLFGTVFAFVSLAAEGAAAFLYAKLLERHKKDDKDPEGRQADPSVQEETIRQPLTAQRIIFGSPKTPGVLIFANVSHEGAEVPEVPEDDNPGGRLAVGQYLVEQHAFAAHETNGLESVSIGQIQDVQFGINGDATSYPFYLNGKSYFSLLYKNGNPAEAEVSDIMRRNFPSLPETHLQQGHTVIDGEFAYGENQDINRQIWGEGRDIRARINGASVYDPRDATQLPDDPSTWKFSDNPALIIAWLLQYDKFLPSGLTYEDIDLHWLEWSADVCDMGVPAIDQDINSDTFGELVLTEKRYTAHGVIDTNQRQLDVIENLLMAMQGSLVHDGRKYVIKAGWPEEIVGTIGDKHVVGDVLYNNGVPASDHIARLSVRCVVPEIDYQEASLPIIRAVNAENEHPQGEGTLTLPYVQGASRGQRIGMIALATSRLQKSIQVLINQEGLKYIPTDVVRFDHSKFPALTGDYRISDIRPNELFNAFEVVMHEYDPEAYAPDLSRLQVYDQRGQLN